MALQCAEALLAEALDLMEASASDPESQPFKSRYKAGEVLTEALNRLQEDSCHLKEALLNYHLSANFHEVEQYHESLTHINKSLDLLEGSQVNGQSLTIHITCLNHKCFVLSSRERDAEALPLLASACQLYRNWATDPDRSVPDRLNQLLKPEECSEGERLVAFEQLHTQTLFLLAQVHRNLTNKYHAILVCFMTLRRVLQSRADDKERDWLDWALNAATLSQCFTNESLYQEASVCLLAAYAALSKNHPKYSKHDGEDFEVETERIQQVVCDVDRCCIKYCINLLKSSWSEYELDPSAIRAEFKPAAEELAAITTFTFDTTDCLVEFPGLESTVSLPCNLALNFEDARQVFLIGQSKCNATKAVLTFDMHCRDFVELVRDHSQLYKHLTYFEHDLSRKIKIHRKRADLLGPTLSELSVQHYLQICRQLQFELAEIHSDISELIRTQCEEKRDVSLESAKKINSSSAKAIKYYTMFIDSCRESDGRLPNTYLEMYARPALIAHFCLGRLYGKLVANPEQRAHNLDKSLQYYQYVRDYCERNPSAKDLIPTEYPMCIEMIELMPAKKQALRSGAKLT